MDKRSIKIIALVASVIALIGAVYCLLRFGFSIDVLDRSGWLHKAGATQYCDYFGRPHTGWKYIDEHLYYFQPSTGNMVTGWQEVDGNRYYFSEEGVRATGWQRLGTHTYYLGEDGKVVTGWQQIDGKNYLFTETGAMATGWQIVDGNRSYFSEEGVKAFGWQEVDGKLYYFNEKGHAVSGIVNLDGVDYRFTDEGAIVTGWFTDETGEYYLNEKGQPHTGWLELDGKRYYFDENGVRATGWITEKSGRYYLNENGKLATGRAEIDGKVHFFTSKGKWVLFCNQWNAVPEDFVVQLVGIEGYRFDSVGRDFLQAMLNDCRKAGFDCTINNTYRSKTTQQYLWDRCVAQYMAAGMTREEAIIETGKDTALPGHSEHQTGLAVDLDGSKQAYAWLSQHCWDYGFILRYPEGKADITGIIYEPWHFRYVGTELALELKELGITFEEYIANITPQT